MCLEFYVEQECTFIYLISRREFVTFGDLQSVGLSPSSVDFLYVFHRHPYVLTFYIHLDFTEFLQIYFLDNFNHN